MSKAGALSSELHRIRAEAPSVVVIRSDDLELRFPFARNAGLCRRLACLDLLHLLCRVRLRLLDEAVEVIEVGFAALLRDPPFLAAQQACGLHRGDSFL